MCRYSRYVVALICYLLMYIYQLHLLFAFAQGRSQRGQGGHAPNRRLSGFFTDKTDFVGT